MIEKIDFDNIAKKIELLGFDKPGSINSIIFVTERLFLTLQAACVRKDFPDEAYRHIELMIAYQFALDEINRLDREDMEAKINSDVEAKAISIENTRVEFNSSNGDLKNSKWANLKDKLNFEFMNEMKIFVQRYRRLVW